MFTRRERSFACDERQWSKVEFVHYFRGAFRRATVRDDTPYTRDAHWNTDERCFSESIRVYASPHPASFFPGTRECDPCTRRGTKLGHEAADMVSRGERGCDKSPRISLRRLPRRDFPLLETCRSIRRTPRSIGYPETTLK